MGKKAYDIKTPHTRGPVAPVSTMDGRQGMIGVEDKTKGENKKWLSYL